VTGLTGVLGQGLKARWLSISEGAGPQVRYFADWVLSQVETLTGRPARELLVTTTLDPKLQAIAERETVAVLEEAAGQQTGPYLWKAKGELGTVYLFGTIHIPSPKVLDLPQAVTDAIAASDIVLTELKLDRDTIAKVQTLMMLPKGETLEDVMPKEDYERIRKKAPRASRG